MDVYGTPAIWYACLRVPAHDVPCPVLRGDHIAELSPHSHQNGVLMWHGQGVEIQILPGQTAVFCVHRST